MFIVPLAEAKSILSELSLELTGLKGSMPDALGSLSGIRSFVAYGLCIARAQGLSGHIPDALCFWTQLDLFYVPCHPMTILVKPEHEKCRGN